MGRMERNVSGDTPERQHTGHEFENTSNAGSEEPCADTEATEVESRPNFMRSATNGMKRLSIGGIKDAMTQALKMGARKTVSNPRLAAQFISGEVDDGIQEDARCITARRRVWTALNHACVEVPITLVVVFDFLLACVDTDLRAAGSETPLWLKTTQVLCLIVYITEFSLLLFVKQARIFQDAPNRFDFIVIVAGISEFIMQEVLNTTDSASSTVSAGTSQFKSSTRIFRLLRGLRMLRLIQKFMRIKELSRLLAMLLNALRTLFWSFLLLFVFMTMWAMSCVEIVHPIVLQLVDSGILTEDCAYAYSSVLDSNLTMFSTIVAGDQWGRIAVPVIRAAPATALIFVGAELTILYGVLNLVIAVVVDTFADQREKDETTLAADMDLALKEDIKFFKHIFRNIDEDGSGDISLPELLNGARAEPAFRSRLRVMDIDETDLAHLFDMLDEDKSGSIDADEFVTTLSRWRHESKTAARFVKYNMLHSMNIQNKHTEDLQTIMDEIRSKKQVKQTASEADTTSRQEGTLSECLAKLQNLEFSVSEVLKKEPQLRQSSNSTTACFSSPIAQVTDGNFSSSQPVGAILLSMHELGNKAQQEYEKLIAEFHNNEKGLASAGTNGILTKMAHMEETDTCRDFESLRVEPLEMEQSCRV